VYTNKLTSYPAKLSNPKPLSSKHPHSIVLISLFKYHRKRIEPSAGVSSHPPGDLGPYIIAYAAHEAAENKFTCMPQIQLEAAPAFSLIACINCFNFNKKANSLRNKSRTTMLHNWPGRRVSINVRKLSRAIVWLHF